MTRNNRKSSNPQGTSSTFGVLESTSPCSDVRSSSVANAKILKLVPRRSRTPRMDPINHFRRDSSSTASAGSSRHPWPKSLRNAGKHAAVIDQPQPQPEPNQAQQRLRSCHRMKAQQRLQANQRGKHHRHQQNKNCCSSKHATV